MLVKSQTLGWSCVLSRFWHENRLSSLLQACRSTSSTHPPIQRICCVENSHCLIALEAATVVHAGEERQRGEESDRDGEDIWQRRRKRWIEGEKRKWIGNKEKKERKWRNTNCGRKKKERCQKRTKRMDRKEKEGEGSGRAKREKSRHHE